MKPLTTLRRAGKPIWLTMTAVLLLLVVTVAAAGPYALFTVLIIGSMWALVAAGLALIFGVMNVPNFAQGEFFMVGTLVAYFAYGDIGPASGVGAVARVAVVLVVGLAAGFILGVLLDLGIFAKMRSRNQDDWIMNTFVVTIGISVILVNGSQMIFGAWTRGIPGYFGGAAFQIVGVGVSRDRVMAVIVGVVTLVALWWMLKHSPFGQTLRAVAQDEVAARMMGVNVSVVHSLTFGIGAALAALAGATLLFLYPFSPFVGVQPLYIAWTVVILAGLGNVGGAFIAGFIVALFQTSISYFIGSQWNDVLTFGLIVCLLLIRPSGLFSKGVKGVWEV
jgi:branched-chain amino acid transport system permease protein